MLRLLAVLCVGVLATVLASAHAAVPLALGGYDVVSCTSKRSLRQEGGKGCTAVGTDPALSTRYSSVDAAGNPLFLAEFRFVSQENMLAFENAPFSFAPRLGGFCAWGLASMNSTASAFDSTSGANAGTDKEKDKEVSAWAADSLGPPVDLVKSWRAVESVDGLPPAIYLFCGENSADSFVAGLPESQQRAEAQWAQWYGSHGTQAPYALSAGPFNSACYTNGDPGAAGPPRDCSTAPMRVPTV